MDRDLQYCVFIVNYNITMQLIFCKIDVCKNKTLKNKRSSKEIYRWKTLLY